MVFILRMPIGNYLDGLLGAVNFKDLVLTIISGGWGHSICTISLAKKVHQGQR